MKVPTGPVTGWLRRTWVWPVLRAANGQGTGPTAVAIRRVKSAFSLAALAARGLGPPAKRVRHGSKRRPLVALTFDDCRDTEQALATLRVLESHKVPATIFVTGQWVEEFPEISLRIADGIAAGRFEVGDHSLSHAKLTELSLDGLDTEIGAGVGAFQRLTGAGAVPLFRPPFGSTNERVLAVAGHKGFRELVLWSVDPQDWAGHSAATIEDFVFRNAHNGAIVLLHLWAPHTAEALPRIVERLRASGYQFALASEVLGSPRAVSPYLPALLLARIASHRLRARVPR